ncbi:MAG: hypothetical protein AAGF24_09930 [Cyanobacteria bacterium P01_H01_bin.121]
MQDRIQSGIERFEALANGELLPWQKSNKPNDYNADFVTHIWTWLKSMKPSASVPRADAIAYLNRGLFDQERQLTIQARWDEYQESLTAFKEAEQAKAQTVLQQPDPHSPESTAARRKAREFLQKRGLA